MYDISSPENRDIFHDIWESCFLNRRCLNRSTLYSFYTIEADCRCVRHCNELYRLSTLGCCCDCCLSVSVMSVATVALVSY